VAAISHDLLIGQVAVGQLAGVDHPPQHLIGRVQQHRGALRVGDLWRRADVVVVPVGAERWRTASARRPAPRMASGSWAASMTMNLVVVAE